MLKSKKQKSVNFFNEIPDMYNGILWEIWDLSDVGKILLDLPSN